MGSPDCIALVQEATKNLGLRHFHEAIELATRAIRLDPRHAPAYVVRAVAFRRLNKHDRALADLSLAIRLEPDRPTPYVIRAEIFKKRCEPDRAIDDATQAIFLDPNNAAAFEVRAACRKAIGDEEGAAEDAGEVLRIDPTRPPVADEKPPSPSGSEPSRKGTARTIPDAYRDLFADGKPVDETYRSLSTEETARLLGRDSRYKPETITPELPRMRARRTTPASAVRARLTIVLVAVLLGGGYVAFGLGNGKESTKESPDGRKPVVQRASQGEPRPEVPPQSLSEVQGAPGEVRSFLGHTGKVTCVAFSPDGRWAVSGGEDKSVRMWEVGTGQEVWKSDDFTKRLLAVSFPADRKMIVAQDQVMVKRLDAGTGRTLEANSTPEMENSTMGNEGRWIVFEGGGKLSLYDVAHGRPGHVADIWTPTIIYNLGGGSVFCGGYESPQHVEELRDLKTGRVLTEYRGSRDRTHALAVSPDGRFLAAGSGVNNPKVQETAENTVRVWEVATGKLVRQFAPLGGWLNAVAFSPDSRLLLAGGGGRHSDWGGFAEDADNSVRLWDVESGRELGKFVGHKGVISTLRFSPDGRYALSGSTDSTVRLWRMPTTNDSLSTDLITLPSNAVGGDRARTPPEGSLPTYLVTLPRIDLREHNGWWSDKGELVLGNPPVRKPFMYQGRHSSHGIYMSALSSAETFITFRLDRRFGSFRSEAVVPEMFPHQGDPRTPLVLKVQGDGRTLWESRPLSKKGDHQPCSVSVTGIDELSLRVECRGADNWGLAAWVEPRLFASNLDAGGPLDGEWLKVSEETNGVADTATQERRITITGDDFLMSRTRDGRPGVYAGKVRFDLAARTFDFVGKGPMGAHQEFKGIYEIDGDTLRLCYVYSAGNNAPRPTRLRSYQAPGTTMVSLTLKRRAAR